MNKKTASDTHTRISVSPLRRDEEGHDGIGYAAFQDHRSFTEMLVDWMLSQNCAPFADDAGFLRKTNLDSCLSCDQWHSLLKGDAVPGIRLTNHLAVLMRSQHTEHDNLPSLLTFEHKGHWQTHKGHESHTHVIEISVEQAQQLRRPLVERIVSDFWAHKDLGHTPAAIQADETQHFTKKLIDLTRRAHPEADAASVLSMLSDRYRTSPDKVRSMLLASFPDASEATVDHWLEDVLKPMADYHGPGRLLKFFRQCEGITQTQLGIALDLAQNTISDWECGTGTINYRQLPKITKLLNLSELEYDQFSATLFPALNSDWLEQQEPARQPGLLLQALRERRGISTEQLAQVLHVDRTTITSWESGWHRINVRSLPLIKEALSVDEINYRRLTEMLTPAVSDDEKQPGRLLAAFRQRAHMSQSDLGKALGYSTDTIGFWENNYAQINPAELSAISRVLNLNDEESKRLRYARLPGLDPEWLKTQDEKKRAGLMLTACREAKGLLQTQMADLVGVGAGIIADWEHARLKPPAAKLPLIKVALDLEETQYAALQLLLWPGLDSAWLEKQDEDKRAGLLLKALREKKGIYQGDLGKALGVTSIMSWETGRARITTKHLPLIREVLDIDEVHYTLLKRLCMPALDPQWLEKQPQPMRTGLVLRTLRERSGLTQKQLGKALGVSDGVIHQWESEMVPIYRAKLPWLKKALNIDNAEYDYLLRQQLKAFDEAWLKKQPLHDQATLLLDAYAERFGKTLRQFSMQEHVDHKQVKKHGTSGIEHLIEPLVTALKHCDNELPADDRWFDDKEADHFRMVCRRSCGLEKSDVPDAQDAEVQKSMPYDEIGLGVVLPPHLQPLDLKDRIIKFQPYRRAI